MVIEVVAGLHQAGERCGQRVVMVVQAETGLALLQLAIQLDQVFGEAEQVRAARQDVLLQGAHGRYVSLAQLQKRTAEHFRVLSRRLVHRRIGDERFQHRQVAKRQRQSQLHRRDQMAPGIPAEDQRLELGIGCKVDQVVVGSGGVHAFSMTEIGSQAGARRTAGRDRVQRMARLTAAMFLPYRAPPARSCRYCGSPPSRAGPARDRRADTWRG